MTPHGGKGVGRSGGLVMVFQHRQRMPYGQQLRIRLHIGADHTGDMAGGIMEHIPHATHIPRHVIRRVRAGLGGP